jgi:hypothetical protein
MIPSDYVIDFYDVQNDTPVAYWNPRQIRQLDVYGIGSYEAKTLTDVAFLLDYFI